MVSWVFFGDQITVPEPGGGAVTIYRAYTLNGVDHIENAVWIEAENDPDALAKARELTSLKCEIWERDRLVARLGSDAILPPLGCR